MVYLAGKAESIEAALAMLKEKIENGEALQKLAIFVEEQGGDPNQVLQPELLPQAPYQVQVVSPKAGYVHSIQAGELGVLAMILGAGRETKEARSIYRWELNC